MLTELGLPYEIRLREVDEDFPAHLRRAEVAEFLAKRKASAYIHDLAADEVLLTADTIVCLENDVLNKPADRAEAQAMLGRLQGRAHDVFTGVCLRTGDGREVVFADCTTVHFRPLTPAEIDYYIDTCQPYDKAGSYGAQDWLGLAAIDRLEGSYFNVMGLPTHRVWAELAKLGALPDSRNA
ncbi:Maf-like protein [Hymenobacter agri]